MTRHILILLFTILSLTVNAQQQSPATAPFQHFDIGMTAGSTGIGIDLSTSITSWLSVRAGASYMPRVNIPFEYDISVGDITGGGKDELYNDKSKFNKMNELMYSFTGSKINRGVHMNRHTMLDNVKLLFDVYPLKNKHWHATAGFYYGSRTFAYGENIPEDAVTFACVAMYNEMYRKAVNNEPILSSTGQDFPEEIRQKFISYGKAHIYLGHFTHDITDENGNTIYKEGETFYLEPDENCEITADAQVNRFRPYIGIGYDGRISKHNDRWNIGFNAGVMFWGGTPSVIVKMKSPDLSTPDAKYYGINLMDDVTDLPYYAKKEADIVNALPVFPVLELRLSYRLK